MNKSYKPFFGLYVKINTLFRHYAYSINAFDQLNDSLSFGKLN